MDNLGPAEPWQIRSFPKGLRERLIDEAHAARCSVGELLTAIVLRHYDASAIASDHASTNALDRAVQLAPLIAEAPRWFKAALFRRVAAQLGIEPPQTRVRRLTHGP